ncbi:LptF/LptG family permease [Halodesulfovibrio spirochaetisodalis]|uniref:LptF/LptG family permease n=1 Tax=Halodesulfovibrio spirochaetisodalis TaxID=1560234 RepID=UPI000A8948F0|nr:LptF/LptG family permease [Halodesulfovibrio spirochaetisodalis]
MHRQIFKEHVSIFCLSMFSLVFLIVIGKVLQLRELFLGLDIGLIEMLKLFGYLIPAVLLMIIPIATMLSVFLTFLRMSSDRELVALKAGGVSLYQLLPAPVVFGSLCTVLTLWVSMFGIAWGMDNFRSSILELAQTRAKVVLQPGVFNNSIPKLMIYSRSSSLATGDLEHVLVQDTSKDTGGVTIIAPKGKIISDTKQGEIRFVLHNGKIYRQDKNQISVLGFNQYVVRLSLSQLVKGVHLGKLRPSGMSYAQLQAIKKDPSLAESKSFIRKTDVEIPKRWAMPFACIVLGIFAMPLACAFEGMRQQMGVVMALGNFLVYYSLLSISMKSGEGGGGLPPDISLWIPNALFAVLAVVGLYLTAKERTINVTAMITHVILRFGKRKGGQ